MQVGNLSQTGLHLIQVNIVIIKGTAIAVCEVHSKLHALQYQCLIEYNSKCCWLPIIPLSPSSA